MNVKLFVPHELASADIESTLELAVSQNVLPPFDASLVDFVTDFAKSLLLDKETRAYPELVVLANFFKPVNISKLMAELEFNEAKLYVGRGLVFHLAPSNVDSVFLYSSLISLLCGNVNVIRVSGGAGEQVKYVLSKINSLIGRKHPNIANRFFVLTYDHSDDITSLISEHCHLRVVWGGDNTVNKIRSLPLRSTASEICFPDRFSAAMFCADAVIALGVTELQDLCSNFFNDSIWFAQQACSSPRLVSWIGEPEKCQEAKEKFWKAFDLLLQDRLYENTPGMVMDRFVTACISSIHDLHCQTTTVNFPTRILLNPRALGGLKNLHCGNGLFFEQYFSSVPEFLGTLTDREQTLSAFGFQSEELEACLSNLKMRSIDRITKIGHALNFSHIWDGYNLLHVFTRCIIVDL